MYRYLVYQRAKIHFIFDKIQHNDVSSKEELFLLRFCLNLKVKIYVVKQKRISN